ncbi:hypothetical protein F5Y19DRAFT_263324 [Xylariaceae sp. FL1651]|nr:hypothetical protein F5Y19DRAFT_263324 [Xylariaceae sp. FL1651]
MSCGNNVQILLDVLSQEDPTLRILEVSAGTGRITNHIMSTLKSFEAGTRGMRFSEYVFTDSSPSFFEDAQTKFQASTIHLNFKALDLDNRPIEQGFGGMSYNFLIGGYVLYATRDMKTQCYLICAPKLSPVGVSSILRSRPDNVITNFVFGVLPGMVVLCRGIPINIAGHDRTPVELGLASRRLFGVRRCPQRP